MATLKLIYIFINILSCKYICGSTKNAYNLKSDINKQENDNKKRDTKHKQNFSFIEDLNRKLLDHKIQNNNKKFFIRPYLQIGIRDPEWLTGLLDIVTPFNKKKNNENKFNFNAEYFNDAINLKSHEEINKYCFANNYGLSIRLDGVSDKDESTGENRLRTLYSTINTLLTTANSDDKKKTNNPLQHSVMTKAIASVLEGAPLTGLNGLLPIGDELIKNVKDLKGTMKTLISDYSKNKNVTLVKNKDFLLSPLGLINIFKFSNILLTTNEFITVFTEKCLNNYLSKSKNSIDSLTEDITKMCIFNLSDNVLSIKNLTKIKDTIDDENTKKKFSDCIDKMKEQIKDIDSNEETRSTMPFSKIYDRLIKDNEKMDKFTDNYNTIKNILSDKQSVIIDSILKKSSDKNLLKNLQDAKLLPQDKTLGGTDAKETIEQFTVLAFKLDRVKKAKEQKEILKKLKKEKTELSLPFNYRAGVNFTYYFHRAVGVNFDISCSYSKMGLTKSIFLQNDFLQVFFYYCYKLHEPILSGRLIPNNKIKTNDVIYSKVKLDAVDLAINGLMKSCAQGDALIGHKDTTPKTAFENYLDLVNYYNVAEGYSLCDFRIKLEQINICLKTGLVLKLNGFSRKKIKSNRNTAHELIFNGGIYFNFQRIKFYVDLNDNYQGNNKDITTKCYTADILTEALTDTLLNLGLSDTSDDRIYNLKYAQLITYIYNKTLRNVAPKNKKVIGYINNIIDDNIPEQCFFTVFNTFKIRYLFEIMYRFSINDCSLMVGCEFIFVNPLNFSSANKNFIKQARELNVNVSNSVSQLKIPDLEILPSISISKIFSF